MTKAAVLLRRSVLRAEQDLLASPPDGTRVNEVLAALAAELAPGFPHLYAIADANPLGQVAAVLANLRVAFAHAANDHFAPAVTSVVTAAANAYPVANEAMRDALDTGASDHACGADPSRSQR